MREEKLTVAYARREYGVAIDEATMTVDGDATARCGRPRRTERVSAMRIGLYQMSQETDTFNPLLTTMDDFAAFGLETGPEMLETPPRPEHDRRLPRGGGGVRPGRRDRRASDTGSLSPAGGSRPTRCASSRTGCEAGWRGRTPRRPRDAAPRRLLRRRRSTTSKGRLLAIARGRSRPGHARSSSTIDHHANVTQAMVDGCDALVGYRTQPHDPFDTAVASTNLLLRIVAGEVRPAMAWRKIPLLSHQEQYLTSGGPMKTWFDRARALEREPGILSVSTFPMQPWLDVEEAGWAAVVVTDGDRQRAERRPTRLADLAWSLRAEFQVKTSVSADEAVSTPKQADARRKPLVILSDHGDSVFGGAAGDSTVLLAALLRLGLAGRALVPLIDPAAVAALAGAESTRRDVTVGGNVDRVLQAARGDRHAPPARVEAAAPRRHAVRRVRPRADAPYSTSGP